MKSQIINYIAFAIFTETIVFTPQKYTFIFGGIGIFLSVLPILLEARKELNQEIKGDPFRGER